jgi:glutamyl-tRNA synthetase
MVEISESTIKIYALENAIKHKGKASQGPVLAGLFAEGLKKDKIKDIMPKIQKVLKKVNEMTPEEQVEAFENSKEKTSKRKIREGLKELENAEQGKVVMRLAPFPSGPLHIGNARNIVLNDEYVKMYDGKLLLCFDDTIGSLNKMIDPEAYDLIKEGLDWLQISYEGSSESCLAKAKKILYKSDRTQKYYEYAEELLKKGYLYVCHCEQEEMQKLKKEGIACSCRELSAEKQLERWKEMFTSPMGSMSVRLKTSMQDPDPAFRDRVMFKISDLPHPRTKDKYRVYPSMEFSWGIDDHVFGSTHILRGTDHHMSTRVQDFIRGIFGWKNPTSFYNGQCEISGAKISKSKSAAKIKSGEFVGHNDPRTWSLQSLRDRGIQPEAIRKFILSLGIKKANITVPVENLYIENKKILGNKPRYFFIEDPEKIHIKGCPHAKTQMPRYPNSEKDSRIVETSQEFLVKKSDLKSLKEKNYRLMYLLTFKPNRIGVAKSHFSYVSQAPKGDEIFLPWLPAESELVNAELLMPDGKIKKGVGESDLAKLKKGDIIQFEKIGYARLHKKSKDKLEFWFAHK